MISALFCPACKIETTDLTHWVSDTAPECAGSAQARAWWHSLLNHALNDTRHRDGKITVTRLLTCPREWLLADFLPHTFDPRTQHTPAVGTLVQAAIAKFPPIGWVAEREVQGTILGLPLSAAIDLSLMYATTGLEHAGYTKEGKICEGKFHSFDKDGYKEWTLKDDHACQVNMQRLLWEQQEPGLRVVEMEVVRSSMAGAGKEMKRFKVPVWDEERIAAHRPGGGDFTVGFIAGKAAEALLNLKHDYVANQGFLGGASTYVNVGEVVKESVPLIGRSMFNKKKCSDYCSLKQVCDRVEGIS